MARARQEEREEGSLKTARKILTGLLQEELGPSPRALEKKVLQVENLEVLTGLLLQYNNWKPLEHVEYLLDRLLAEDEKTN
jgi:hypothetical protein